MRNRVLLAAGTVAVFVPALLFAQQRPAPRPAFSVLASGRPAAPALPAWRDGLKAHLTRVEVAA